MVLVDTIYFIFEGNLIFVKQIVEKITTNNEAESCFDFFSNSPIATSAPSSCSRTGKKIESLRYDPDKEGLSVDDGEDDNVLNKTLSSNNFSSGSRNDNILQGENPSLSRNFAEINSHDELTTECREKVSRCAERANKLNRVRKAIEFLHSLRDDDTRKDYGRRINGGDFQGIKENKTRSFHHEDEVIEISYGNKNHSWTVDCNMKPIRDQQTSELTFNEEIVRNPKKQPSQRSQVSGNWENTCEKRHGCCLFDGISTLDKVDVTQGTIGVPTTSGPDQIKEEENTRKVVNVGIVKNGTQQQNLEISRCLSTEQRKAVVRNSRSLVRKVDVLKSVPNVANHEIAQDPLNITHDSPRDGPFEKGSTLLQIEPTLKENDVRIDETANFIWNRDFNGRKSEEGLSRSLVRAESLTNATERNESIGLKEELDRYKNKASGELFVIESCSSLSPICKEMVEEEDTGIRPDNENESFDENFELLEDDTDTISIHSSYTESIGRKEDTFLDIANGNKEEVIGSSSKIRNFVDEQIDEQSNCSIVHNSIPVFRFISSFDVFPVKDVDFVDSISNVQKDTSTIVNFPDATNCKVLSSTPKKPISVLREPNENSIMEKSLDHTLGSTARSLLFSIEKATTGRRGDANDSGVGTVKDNNCSHVQSDGESQHSNCSQSDQSVQMFAELSSKLFKLDGLLKEIKSSNVFGRLSDNLSFPVTEVSSNLESQSPDTFAVNKSGSISDEFDETCSNSPSQEMFCSIERFDDSSKIDTDRIQIGKCDNDFVSHQCREVQPKMQTDSSDVEESNDLFNTNNAMINRMANDDVQNDRLYDELTNESLKMNLSIINEGKAFNVSKINILKLSDMESRFPSEVIDLTGEEKTKRPIKSEDSSFLIDNELEERQRRKHEFDVIDLTACESSSSDDTFSMNNTDLDISAFNESPREKKAKTSKWSNYVFDFTADASSPEKQNRYDRFANDRSDIFPACTDIDSNSSLRLHLKRSSSSPFYS